MKFAVRYTRIEQISVRYISVLVFRKYPLRISAGLLKITPKFRTRKYKISVLGQFSEPYNILNLYTVQFELKLSNTGKKIWSSPTHLATRGSTLCGGSSLVLTCSCFRACFCSSGPTTADTPADFLHIRFGLHSFFF